MISIFPSAYPDELLYSQFARFYSWSGYMFHCQAAQQLYTRNELQPDTDFYNVLAPDALKIITTDQSMEDIVMKKTMFPYYGRFMPLERRMKAYEALVNMQGRYNFLIQKPRRGAATRYLKYCPLCAEQDRQNYGEAYWHREHQMLDIAICPIHDCYLIDSVLIGANGVAKLKPADIEIPLSDKPIYSNSDVEVRLAKYMSEVFHGELDLRSPVCFGQFLRSYIEEPKYISTCGKIRNMEQLTKDFTHFYKSASCSWITESWQLGQILYNQKPNFYAICQVSMFLNIPASDLILMRVPEKSKKELFDETVYKLYEQGLTPDEIAKELNVSRSLTWRRVTKIRKQKNS